MRDSEFVLQALRAALERRYCSVDEFLGFLEKKGVDLQALSLAQIEERVEEFCEQMRQSSEFRGVEGIEDDYRYHLGNDRPVLTNFFVQDVEIRVVEENFRKRFLLFSESEYVIETVPLGWKVTRTVAHFAELESLLRGMLPFIFVPPFGPAEFAKLAKQSQTCDARRQHLQLFLNALIENPYIKNSSLLSLFLSSDLLDEELAQLRQQKMLRTEFERTFGAKRHREARSVESFLKALPAFSKNALVLTDHCSIQLTNSLPPFLTRLTELDTTLLKVAREVRAKANALSRSLSCFAQLLCNRAALKEGLARDFDLEYGRCISLADLQTARWAEVLKAQVKKTQDFFSNAYLSALNYQRIRDESFGQYHKDVMAMRAAVKVPKGEGEGREGAGEPFDALKAYLTSMLNFSFKHMMIFRNRQECAIMSQKLSEACSSAEHAHEEFGRIHSDLCEKCVVFPSNSEFIANFVAMTEES